MRVTGIKLRQFRSYEALDLKTEPGLVVLTGQNGTGKTNILEALFLCALGKSHRTNRDGDLIRIGSNVGLVELTLDTLGGSRVIRTELKEAERKKITIDARPLARSGELMGCLNVVMFSPEDLSLVKGSPAERRRFLDMEISQLKPAYYYALQQYNNALKQRNNLLKDEDAASNEMLELWDEQLSKHGALIMQERAAFCRELKEKAGTLHRRMSGGKELLVTDYAPDVYVKPGGDCREAIAESLINALDKDLFRGYTSAGPHRDDISLTVNGLDARIYASQGQQRTAALSLKLSEIAVTERLRGEKPVLLLDDVFSELDSERQRLLLGAAEGCQCFITCTGLEELGPMENSSMQLFGVKNGQVWEL